MRASKSRIEINDFPGSERYGVAPDAATAAFVGPLKAGAQRQGSLRRDNTIKLGRSAARFDVRNATCAKVEDADQLLAVIESCGAGFEDFNQWMHELLLNAARGAEP